jgi:hypothetical protein
MIDIFLRTDTPQALRSGLPFLWDKIENTWITGTFEFSFDPIGSVVTDPGEYDENDEEISPVIIDNRFHANLRCTEKISIKIPRNLMIHPKNPIRTWA